MEKRWNILTADEDKIRSLQAALKIHRSLCQILVQRGIESFEQAKNYFRPQLTDLHSPWLMKDMEKAVTRIREALARSEKILVYGDYDVDGTTSVACLYHFLKKIHPAVGFYIPHRYREGYGISRAGIRYAQQEGYGLVISLDCGIKSAELIGEAAEMGIDFIVCDHHLPDEKLPPAIAILNPKQTGCPYPYKELCGCGVGFKLIAALAEQLALPPETAYSYLDLVATAIAADIVPMTGENRILAFHGLVKANNNPNPGIKALAKLSGLQQEMNITNLVFMIAPRVNAAGRMDDASKAVQLFIAETEQESLHFAEQLHSDNRDRKEADKSITEEALAQIEAQPDWKTRKSTVVFQPHWHKGVVGIVASRVIETFFRPTVVLTQSGEYASGSARSVPGFNLYEAIHACRDHLLGYGGHFAAAGLTLELEQVDAFREKFEAAVAAVITPAQLVPEIVIDAVIRLSDIKPSFYSILCQMEPFGPENAKPVFLIKSLRDSGYSRIVKEEHIRFSLREEQVTLTGIGFRMADKFSLLARQQPVDIVCHLDENEWNDSKQLQVKVIDIRPAGTTD